MHSQLVLLSIILLSASAQVLELTPGKVLGFDYKTKKGDHVEVYLNIPYASAPVGDLRFERPKPPNPWGDIRDCRKFGPVCHPILPQAIHKGENASEDCLTLNIIRPKKEAPHAGFPILFWVHGGAWEIGSGREVGYEGLADIYAANDIVVVTIQYRLSVYGFFSTGDERIPGNMGLFDMAQALKFIYSNADHIGGDPARITVWGHSAGSASVTMLILSPVTRDYIRSSIEMSGAPWASWALGTKVANDSLELAEALGCSKDMKECMKTKTVEEIYKGIEKVGATTDGLRFLKWGAVIDGVFLQHPDEMTAEAQPKSSIVGSTNKEAALFSILGTEPFRYFHNLYVRPEEYDKWNREKLVGELKKIIKLVYVGNHLDELTNDVIGFYVDRGEEQSNEFYVDRFTEFLSDVFFNIPVANGILARRVAGWDIYAYYLDHHNDAIFDDKIPSKLRGAPHAGEFPYTSGVGRLGKVVFDDKEQVVADVFRESFVEFIKIRSPSNHHEVWLDIGNEESLRYLRVTPDPQMDQGFHKEALSFWRKMRKYGFDLTQLLPIKPDAKEEL